MAGQTSLASLTDADIGRPKVERDAVDIIRDISMAEMERMKRRIVELSEIQGLGDGSTSGSNEARLRTLESGGGSVPTTRTITAGTGLTGGGTLAADRTLSADFGTGAGKVTQGNDARLSDARTPTAHATSHKHGGSDEIATATAAANAIPKADGSGKLDTWITDATTGAKGKIQIDTATPSAIATAGAAGSSGKAADSGHTHALSASTIAAALAASSYVALNTASQVQDFVGPPAFADLGVLTGADINEMYTFAVSGSGAVATWAAFLQAEAGHPGTVTVQTGSTNAGSAAIFALFGLNANSRGRPKYGGGVIRLKYIFQIIQLSTAGEEFKVRVGSIDNGLVPTGGMWFEYDRVTSVNWRIKTVTGTHVTTSSVAVTAGVYHLAEIVISANAQTIEFFMDGVSLGSFTDAGFIADAARSACFAIEKTAGTTTRALTADYCDYSELFTNPRA